MNSDWIINEIQYRLYNYETELGMKLSDEALDFCVKDPAFASSSNTDKM